MNSIIVDNLSKKYSISGLKSASYTALRDVMANAAHQTFHRILRPFSAFKKNGGDNEFWALNGIKFKIDQGERVGIVGRNGAGKTTLLKILSRITAPTSGRAEITGRVGSLLEVGAGFHHELTGRENIFFNGAILGMSRREIQRKFDEIVAFAEVEKFLDTPVKRYSSGMYVRLAFSVAAYLEPEILLIDEVLAVGDAQFQKKCLGRMENISSEGRTLLFVSHDMAAVSRLCSRAILLDSGRIINDGKTHDVLNAYVEMFSKKDPEKNLNNPRLRLAQSNPDSIFKWTNIKIINKQGESVSEVRYHEPFEIVAQGFSAKKCDDILIGLNLNSRTGGMIFTTHQIYNGLSGTLPKGVSKFGIKIEDNFLAPGFYEIGIAAEGHGVGDWIPASLDLRVSSLGITPDKFWYAPRKAGVVDYPCTWKTYNV